MVLAVFAVLIVIALGGLTNQFVASIQNSAPDELPMIDSALASTAAAPTTAAEAAPTTDAPTSAAAPPTDVPVKAVAGLVFDPQGDGTPDYKDYVDRAFDGNADSAWLTWVYKQQFPSLKTGVGLLLELERETTPTSVTVNSATNGTVIEIRSAASPTVAIRPDQRAGQRHGHERHGDDPADRRTEVEVPDRVRHEVVADAGQSVPVQDQRDHGPGQPDREPPAGAQRGDPPGRAAARGRVGNLSSVGLR